MTPSTRANHDSLPSTPANHESLRASARARSWLAPAAYLFAPLGVLTLLFFAPLATMVRQSVAADSRAGTAAGFTVAHYARFFGDPYYLSALLVTLGTAALVTLITVVVGLPDRLYVLACQRPIALAARHLVALALLRQRRRQGLRLDGAAVAGVSRGLAQRIRRRRPHQRAPIAAVHGAARGERDDAHRARAAGVGARVRRERAARVVGRWWCRSACRASWPAASSCSASRWRRTWCRRSSAGAPRGRFLPVLMYQQVTIAQNWGFGGGNRGDPAGGRDSDHRDRQHGRAPGEARAGHERRVQWVSGSWLATTSLAYLFLAAPIAIVLVFSFSDGASFAFPPQGFSLRWFRYLAGRDEFLCGRDRQRAGRGTGVPRRGRPWRPGRHLRWYGSAFAARRSSKAC